MPLSAKRHLADKNVEIVTLAQNATLVPSQESKELALPPGLKIAASIVRSRLPPVERDDEGAEINVCVSSHKRNCWTNGDRV